MKNFKAISDGTFTLQEAEKPNQFYFYRNNGDVLGNISREPIDLYQTYIIHNTVDKKISYIDMNNIKFEKSADGKWIKLTICGTGESLRQPDNSDCNSNNQEESLLKRLFNKFF